MNLKELNELISTRTAKVGEITRQLALAGIAIIWIFKRDVSGQPAIPKDLFTPAIWIILSLGFDLLQYASSSAFWITYRIIKEKKLKRGRDEEQSSRKIKNLVAIEFEMPDWFNFLHYVLFWAKVISLIIAYWFLLDYLYRSIYTY